MGTLTVDQFKQLQALARDYAVATADGASHTRIEPISRLLQRIREAFRMEVVFISEFVAGNRVFRWVDVVENGPAMVKPGAADPLEASYCQRVVDRRLPRAMQNAMDVAEAQSLPATRAIPVGGHLSVPIVLPDGSVFGTLCCFSRQPVPTLADSDAQALEAIANLIAAGLDKTGSVRKQLLLRDIERGQHSGE